MRKVAIIGAGVVGTALGVLLARKGYSIVAVASRSPSSAQRASSRIGGVAVKGRPAEAALEGELVFLTTPDDVIGEVAREIAGEGGFREGQVVAHTSGALPSTVLEPARKAGASIASLHPLQSFAEVEVAIRALPGSVFCLEGDPEAREILLQVARDLSGRVLTIPTHFKPLYHAAAVVASNLFVTLVWMSYRLYGEMGLGEEEAQEALLPLIRGTLGNIEALGPVKALTGPVARGDVATVRSHLEAFSSLDPFYGEIYRTLSRLTVELALRKGTLSEERSKELLELLEAQELKDGIKGGVPFR